MADFSKTAANALKSIAANGRVLTLKRNTRTFDNVTGEPTANVVSTGTITAVVLPRYKGTIFKEMDDALKQAIITGRARTVLAAAKDATFPPQPLDRIVFDGADWEVVGVTELSPTGIPILYTMGVMQK